MIDDYLAIVFGRNENKTVRQVLDSLLAQTIPPRKINVIDDGSTDGMYQTILEYEVRYPNLIKSFRYEPHPSDFSRLPLLWNTGMERNYSFHLILPTDASLVPNYAEFILGKMNENPNLIIASGDWGLKRSVAPHGGGRFVRQDFFNHFYPNGYPRILGYESEILERAVLSGHQIKCFREIEIIHYEELGHSHNFKEFGYGMKCLGYYPPYAIARCVWDFLYNKQMGKRGALNMLRYYLLFTPAKEGYYSKFPEDICQAVRAKQKNIMKRTFNHKFPLVMLRDGLQKVGIRNTGILTKVEELTGWSI